MLKEFLDLIMRLRRVAAGVVLAFCVTAALSASFLLRFDFDLPATEWQHLKLGLALALSTKLVVFAVARLHRGWWSSVSTRDLIGVAYGTLAASVVFTVAARLLIGPGFPRSVYILDFILTSGLICGARLAVKLISDSRRSKEAVGQLKSIVIYGAGWSGASLAKELQAFPRLGYRVAGFIDDNPAKKGDSVVGLPVLGAGRDLSRIVSSPRKGRQPIEAVLIAMPSASSSQLREAVRHIKDAGLPCKTLPGIGELLENGPLRMQIRDLSVEDLLSREAIQLDEGLIRQAISGRVVLVTGAGGTIGSELCRQTAEYGPRKLILLDQAESDLFRIHCEIQARFPGVETAVVIGDVRDPVAALNLYATHKVEITFHAAAYKHVPLMESHPVEAARTNIVGTWNMASAAQAHDSSRFVLISSDKAVNPGSVMGATKRAAELITKGMTSAAANGAMKFVSVRFGNVLASNGSVVPIFREQISKGGPVTVTHEEMRRYFMTTREAVQLVLQAAAIAQGSETFVLDMGAPVRILDLARTMINLCGLVPDKDIKIKITGMRPGEKLFEELITSDEETLPTIHPKVKIFKHPAVDRGGISLWLEELRQILEQREEEAVVRHLCRLIPEYQVNRRETRESAEQLKSDAAAVSRGAA